MNYRERIRKAIECPQFGNERYGEWGALNLEKRILIKRLLDELDRADNYVKNLYLENQELKKHLEEYKATNEILSHELTKDKLLQQECLTTCCGIPIGDIPKFIDKYNKLENNWNELKKYIQDICCYDEVGLRIIDPSYLEDKIAELERGVSDEN